MKLERLLNYLRQLPPETDVFIYSDTDKTFVLSADKTNVYYLAHSKQLFFGSFDAFIDYIEEARAPKSNA